MDDDYDDDDSFVVCCYFGSSFIRRRRNRDFCADRVSLQLCYDLLQLPLPNHHHPYRFGDRIISRSVIPVSKIRFCCTVRISQTDRRNPFWLQNPIHLRSIATVSSTMDRVHHFFVLDKWILSTRCARAMLSCKIDNCFCILPRIHPSIRPWSNCLNWLEEGGIPRTGELQELFILKMILGCDGPIVLLCLLLFCFLFGVTY